MPDVGHVELSVVIPVHNAAAFIRPCLDSVLSQEVKLEIICVDDCSSDDSYGICCEYSRRHSNITVLRNEKQLFAGGSRNRGIEIARGEYIAFLDADDMVNPGMYRRFCDLARETRADILRGTATAFDHATGEEITGLYYEQRGKGGDLEAHTMPFVDCFKSAVELAPVPWIGICRLSLIKAHNIRFNDFPCCEDVGFFYDLISRGNAIRFVREPIVTHRRDSPGSLLGQTARQYEYVLKTVVYVQEHSRAFPPEVRCAIMQSVLKSLPQWMRKTLDCGIAHDVVKERFDRYISQLDVSIWGISFFAMPWVHRLVEMFGIGAFLCKNGMSRSDAEFVMQQSKDAAGAKAELKKARRALKIAERECCNLKRSSAYRIGMVVTCPARMVRDGIRCLRENGVKYTLRHAIGKVLRKCGSKINAKERV